MVKLCRSASCAVSGRARSQINDRDSICNSCREHLKSDLLRLPGLYEDCNKSARQESVLAIRKGPRKSSALDAMSPAATEIRSSIRSVLASWAGLVAAERHLNPPVRDVPTLARFLALHVAWLARHDAAADLADEVRELTRTARSIAYPNGTRRVQIACCPDDCAGQLVAVIHPDSTFQASEIVCTKSPSHSWPAAQWARLAHKIRASQGNPA